MSKNAQILLENLIEQEFQGNESYGNISDYFEFFSASQILKNQGLSDDEIENGIVGKGLDGGCDSIYLFLNNLLITPDIVEHISAPKDSILELIIIQSKKTTSFGEDAIMKWKTVSSNLLDLSNTITDFSTRYNADVLEAFTTFRDTYTKLITSRIKLKFRFYYATLASDLHPNVEQQAEELKSTVKLLFPNASVEVEFIDSDKLFDMYNSVIENRVNLKFADIPISPNQKNYVALVDLKSYYQFIVNDSGEIRKSFFDSNVRDYQGKNNVNSSISETLHRVDNNDFWWLNNGITILASNISPVTSRSLIITEPEIVNGLQTSNEIYNFFSEYPEKLDSDSRHVLVRIIVPSTETVRDDIILATNNQTSIPKSSLRVSDSIHWQIEMFFKQRGLFYDRRKNHYKNLGKKRSEIISVSYLAQSLIAVLLQKPNYSRARPSTLLTNNDYYNFLYKGEIDLIVYYKIIIWANRIKNYLRQCGLYNTSQQGDLLFYVLYYSFARKNNSHKISPNDVQSIDAEALSDGDIAEYCNHIYEIYHSLGGTGKIAKGSQIIEMLIREFE